MLIWTDALCVFFFVLRCRSPGHAVFRLEEGLGRPSPRQPQVEGLEGLDHLKIRMILQNPTESNTWPWWYMIESIRWLQLSRSHDDTWWYKIPKDRFFVFLHLVLTWIEHPILFSTMDCLANDCKTIRHVGIRPRNASLFRPRLRELSLHSIEVSQWKRTKNLSVGHQSMSHFRHCPPEQLPTATKRIFCAGDLV